MQSVANGGCNWPKWTENCGEDELWKWRACFPCKCDTGRKTNSKRATPDVVTIKKPKTIFEFGLLSIIAYLHHSSSFISFLSSISSRFFFFSTLSKTCHAVRNRTACFSTRYTVIVFKYGTPHTDVVYAHQANIFRTLEARMRRKHLPVLLAILFHKIKTSCARMTK